MKKVPSLILATFLISFWWLTASAKASLRPLPTFGNFQWANQTVTPADNTFIMHNGAHTVVTPLSGDATVNRLVVDQKTNESRALVKNVGFYKGKSVNLLVTLKRNKSNLKGGSLSFSKTYFLGIDVDGEVKVTYNFVDEHDNPLTIKTAFNYYGLNTNKYIGYQNPDSVISAIYANNPTNIMYDTEDQWIYLKNITAGVPWRDPRQSFEVVTKAISQVTFVVHNNDSTISSLVYLTEFLAKPELAPAYAVDAKFDQADRDVYLAAQQTIPISSNLETEISFNLAQVHHGEQYVPERVVVTNFNGEDVTKYFTSQIEDQKVQIKTKGSSADQISDTALNYKVYLKWQGKEKPVDPKKVIDGKLTLPFDVTTTINGQSVGKSGAVTAVNYIGKVTTMFLNEDDEKIHDAQVKSGILTTNFDLAGNYPEIKGYFPLKNDPKKDKGIFLPSAQTIVHRYRKGQELKFKLKDAGTELHISRFTNKGRLAFSFTHEDSQPVKLIASYDGEKRVLKDYVNAASSVKDEVEWQCPKNWIDKKVSFYIEDDHHQSSNKEDRVVRLESGPQLTLPYEINFGTHEIPGEKSTVPLATKAILRIKDRRKIDQGRWTLKVRERHPLTNQDGQVLSRRLLYQGTTINKDEQIIYQTTGDATLDLSKLLKLQLNLADQIGDYQGGLGWTIEDAPN